MALGSHGWLVYVAIQLLATSIQILQARISYENGVKSSVFLSPKFVLGPGSVVNKYYYNIDFPKGHVALKSFDAEVVDESGNPIPLHETYIHHWVVVRYYHRKGVRTPKYNGDQVFRNPDFILVRNSGVCDNLGQYFGLGSETRKTDNHVPDPYGIEVGNPEEVPAGYEEKWLLNVHAIDTRGVEDMFGCTECRCDLYNVTKGENGISLPPDYIGGLRCCRDMMQCRLREGSRSLAKGLYLKYTVKWIDWDSSISPVQIYIFDVTDKWKRLDKSTEQRISHACGIEYGIESCASGVTSDNCIDSKRASFSIPNGGDVIYGVAHQHRGGIGAVLYGEDGRVICSSKPTYGEGKEAGNEAGYIVGMSTCYPQPGSVKLFDGEVLTLESNYSSVEVHTGVMGLFYVLVADPSPGTKSILHASVHEHEKMGMPTSVWGLLLVVVTIAVAAAIVAYRRRSQGNDGYQSILT